MNKDIISQNLTSITKKNVEWTTNEWGNSFGWLRLKHPGIIIEVAKYLATQQARLCTMTAYADKRSDPHKRRSLAYHFVIGSTLLTITTPLYNLSTYEPLPVSSITPWFRNADWNEREFHEMFNIQVVGHPNPKRLFLDERVDTGIMEQLIPFSAMVHSASTTALWERVMASKAALTIEEGREAVLATRKAESGTPSDDGTLRITFPQDTESLARVEMPAPVATAATASSAATSQKANNTTTPSNSPAQKPAADAKAPVDEA